MDYTWWRFIKAWSFSFLRSRRISFGFWLTVASERRDGQVRLKWGDLDYSIYQPLNTNTKEFRVLLLNPGKRSDSLSGTLITSSLLGIKYEALSYEWGSGLGPHCELSELELDGRKLSITPNLDLALRHIRLEDKPRQVWADAVCINQNDTEEKSHQVMLMKEIYRYTQNVIAWLGLETEHSQFGIEILDFFSTAESSALDPHWATLPPNSCKAGLEDILSRSYFSRIWVVQEVALSHRTIVLCGNQQFVWSSEPRSLRHFIRMIKLAVLSPAWEQRGLTDVDFSNILYRLELQQQQGEPPSQDIVDIAYDMRNQKASDRRDKIWGVVGLCQDPRLRELIRPDYHQSVDESYRAFVEAVETHS